jgi:type IV secretory pathway TrbF-like protein
MTYSNRDRLYAALSDLSGAVSEVISAANAAESNAVSVTEIVDGLSDFASELRDVENDASMLQTALHDADSDARDLESRISNLRYNVDSLLSTLEDA